jgi:hypothetical protein
LGHAVSERPVLTLHFNQVDEDIADSEAGCSVDPLGDRLVEGLLLHGGPTFIEGDLDNDEIVRVLHAEVGVGEDEIGRFVLVEDLKSIILGDADREQGLVDRFADRLAIAF